MPDEKQDTENTRVPFWSVLIEDRLKFSVWFFIFFFVGFIFILLYEIVQVQSCAWKTILNIGKAITPIGLSAFTLTFAIFEGRQAMSYALETFFKKRRQEGRQEGRQEILDAIKKAYPEIDLSIIDEPNGMEKESGDKKKF